MAEPEPSAGAIERGPRIGVPAGARILRPKSTFETPLSAEELEKFKAVLGDGAPAAPPARQAPLALVADDDPQTRRLFASALKNVGFECLEAADGPSALREAARLAPDLLILDLAMPGLDGYEVLRGVRSYLRMVQTIIMVVTGMGKDEDEVVALGLGADDFLVKPVRPARLAARVKAVGRRINAGR